MVIVVVSTRLAKWLQYAFQAFSYSVELSFSHTTSFVLTKKPCKSRFFFQKRTYSVPFLFEASLPHLHISEQSQGGRNPKKAASIYIPLQIPMPVAIIITFVCTCSHYMRTPSSCPTLQNTNTKNSLLPPYLIYKLTCCNSYTEQDCLNLRINNAYEDSNLIGSCSWVLS